MVRRRLLVLRAGDRDDQDIARYLPVVAAADHDRRSVLHRPTTIGDPRIHDQSDVEPAHPSSLRFRPILVLRPGIRYRREFLGMVTDPGAMPAQFRGDLSPSLKRKRSDGHTGA